MFFFTSTIIDQLLVTARKRSLGQLSREGVLCPEGRSLSKGEGSLPKGKGSLSKGEGLCPGGSLSRWVSGRGVSVLGVLCRGDPSRTETAPIW